MPLIFFPMHCRKSVKLILTRFNFTCMIFLNIPYLGKGNQWMWQLLCYDTNKRLQVNRNSWLVMQPSKEGGNVGKLLYYFEVWNERGWN